MRTLVNWLRLHGTLLPHRNGHLWLTHSKRLINEHLLLVLLHVHVVWQLPLTLIVGGLLLWLVTGLYWNWHLHLLVLTLMSRSHILLIILRLLISAKLSLILIVSFIWWSRVCLFLFKFLIAMSKWAFLTIGTHTLLEIFTKFCLIISTALWWDERFIEILLLHALILIASKEVTLASSRGLSHLHRVLKSTTAIVSHATSASTVEVVVTATASSLVIVINTSATIIRNLTLMLVGLHEVSLVELWLLSLNLTSWGVIVLEASLIWHLLSIHLISLVLEASWSTTSSISSTSTGEALISTRNWFFKFCVTMSEIAFVTHDTMSIVFKVTTFSSLVLWMVNLTPVTLVTMLVLRVAAQVKWMRLIVDGLIYAGELLLLLGLWLLLLLLERIALSVLKLL